MKQNNNFQATLKSINTPSLKLYTYVRVYVCVSECVYINVLGRLCAWAPTGWQIFYLFCIEFY